MVHGKLYRAALMASRFDISQKLIHFTSGESADDAFARLTAIIGARRLIGGASLIRGSYKCVCFTEAPLAAFTDIFVRRYPFTRYSQFGLMFEKSWIYDRGGRPVIYQPDSDFNILPDELRWRHVRFELTGDHLIDFTWEREWRIRCDELPFSEAEAIFVVPNDQWVDALRDGYDAAQDLDVQLYSMVMEKEIAELWRQPFRWRVVTLQ